jgi:hypothetical protein
MEKVLDLSLILENAPRNCWLALNEEQSVIIARGETAKDAVEEARRRGVEDPILLWSPKSLIPTVY